MVSGNFLVSRFENPEKPFISAEGSLRDQRNAALADATSLDPQEKVGDGLLPSWACEAILSSG
jgi:hypothetical protein